MKTALTVQFDNGEIVPVFIEGTCPALCDISKPVFMREDETAFIGNLKKGEHFKYDKEQKAVHIGYMPKSNL